MLKINYNVITEYLALAKFDSCMTAVKFLT